MTSFAGPMLLSLLLQISPAAPQTQQPSRTATIEGTVLRSGTNEPVSRAQVTVTRATTSPVPAGPPAAPAAAPAGVRGASPASAAGTLPVVTGSDGKFVIRDLPPGSYRLSAARNGFARQEYGQRSLRNPGVVINLVAGQNLTDVVFKLIPAGTISGRVTDHRGEPLAGVTVQLLRSVYDAQGRKSLLASLNVKTNDLGEYRLYWVTQGTYYLNATTAGSYFQSVLQGQMNSIMNTAQAQSGGEAAGSQGQQTLASIFGFNANEVVEPGFATTYYPGTVEPSRAVAIDVQGSELRAMDISLIPQAAYRIQGSVVDGRSGQIPQTAMIQLASRTQGAQMPKPMTSYDSATGNFEFRDVPPGEYTAVAMIVSITSGTTPSVGTAVANVDVSGSDVNGLALTVRQGVSVSGRVNVEGAQSPAAMRGLDRVRIRLVSASELSMGLAQPAAVKADGAFVLDNVGAGEYRVAAVGLPPEYYVKAARYAGSDAMNESATISSASSGSIDILLSPNAGQVSGTLVDKDQKPVAATSVVLIPDRQRDRKDTYKLVVSDAAGKYIIRGIPPGSYRLFAWEDIEPFAYYDTEVLRQFEVRGIPVNVSDSSKITQDVKIIPAMQ